MTSITVNEALLAQLREVKGCVEVQDVNGAVVGFFSPVGVGSTNVDSREVDLYADFDLAEMERRLVEDEKCGVPLTEVYERLKAITPEPEWRDHLQQQIDQLKARDRCDTP